MELLDCLPAELRGPTTTIAPIAAGLSGAGVYRVEANGQTFVLKIARDDHPLEVWQRSVEILRMASDAGVSPRLIHADEAKRAVVTAFVVDRVFPALLMNPATRADAIGQLGRMLRRVHDLPLLEGMAPRDPRDLLTMVVGWLGEFPLPSFVTELTAQIQAEVPPPRDRPDVLNHGDLNPTNLTYDGERVMLLDWDTSGPGDPFYDLASISLFFRFDDETCRALIAAHDGAPLDPGPLPARFLYCRKLVAVMIGSMFFHLARMAGHAGATGGERLDTALGLLELYPKMRDGSLSLHTGDGRWAFGLALFKTLAALANC